MELLKRIRRPHTQSPAAALCAWAALLFSAGGGLTSAASAAPMQEWQQSPYRVKLLFAVESATQPNLQANLAAALIERTEAFLSPLWVFELEVAQSPAARRACLDPGSLEAQEAPPTKGDGEFDKLMWLGVRAAPLGCELVCREFDVYTRRWGPVRRRTAPQRAYLSQACFDLMQSAFSPLAVVTAIPEKDAQVQLVAKGSGLPRPADFASLIEPGDPFQPLLRRTDRNGQLLENGVAAVPWTYLTAVSSGDDAWLANVHTGIRRPFGIQRGRVEQLAVAVRNPPGPTRVRFHARRDPKQGLPGYEVFRDKEGSPPEFIGLTDGDGVIFIPPGDKSVTMLLLRSEGQVLAKAPVPNGSGELLEVPIADNVARLRAQAEARVVREQLVDVVARRAIMMARIRSLLKNNRVDDARKLMAELDALPTASAFGRTIDAALKKIPETDDPVVQRTIDKLFSSTRDLLSKFLDRRPINELQTQVNSAQGGGS